MHKINNHLYRLRRIRGYSQKTLAALGSCPVKAISDFERGVRLPPLRVAMLLEIILGTKVSEIYVDLHRELGLSAVDREARLAPRFTRHIRGRVLGKD
ncbi:MAG: helix-turn-helix transcriptional regulator [Hyphomicrobium sp.]|jgi:DNA-binding XRE family transcriptional regulator